MKLYIEAKPHPWVTWDKDLWKVAQRKKVEYFDITSIENDADAKMVEYTPELLDQPLIDGKKYVLYVEDISEKEAKIVSDAVTLLKRNVKILSDSIAIIDMFKKFGVNVYRWNKPTRVNSNFEYKDQFEIMNKTGGFTITTNGSRTSDNLSEILRTYFAMCLVDDPEHEGELKCMQDVDIFSAYALPFETFNNVHFHGLQPNPKMFKVIKNSKLFISPYNGNGVPINAIDSVLLGTPILVRDTEVNRSIFNWDDKCFYSDEKELAKKIKFFSDISVDDPEYIKIVENGFYALGKTHSASKSLMDLIYILEG